ncbi:kinesin-domain-containing protein [Hesseltinella vesiculosa]|uniref:Kinesin-domain-containing protein n=1 Tax=Hesseltinella vesiculosa TaxID=101127 RepID=A0A1X2G5K7_9FUNG|nr:kinesin-domain-containing protein [Hesseltinella vesiculosa]
MVTKDIDSNALTAVQVAVRIRPLTERDRQLPRFASAHDSDVLQAFENTVAVAAHNKSFTFDHVFGPDTQQVDIFTALGEKAIHQFVEGYNVTMLAYGQTSSGKTYTMGTAQLKGRYDPLHEGIVPRASTLLFDLLRQRASPSRPNSPFTGSTSMDGRRRPLSRISYSPTTTSPTNSNNNKTRFTVKVSFVEIYNEELIDLLNDAPPHERPPVNIREDTKGQIYWTGVKELVAHNVEDILMFLQMGTQNRATSATDMNEQSSRSHAIFSVTLRQEKWTPSPNGSTSSSRPASAMASPKSRTRPVSAINMRMNNDTPAEDGEWIITSSKLHFVDLAGSERLKRTAAEGDRRKEGININGGLLALGNVISALGDTSKRSTHIPYRDSKLTRLLQDSLGGSAKTLMIACVSPAEHNISESLNTLQYANRARNIKNRVEKNEMEEWMITDNLDLLRSTITKLKNELRFFQQQQQPSSPRSLSRLQNDHLHPSQQPLSASSSLATSSTTGPASPPSLPIALPLSPSSSSMHPLSPGDTQQLGQLLERNQWLEHQLVLTRKDRAMSPAAPANDFEHLVEPVIQEYEKSLASLESQLSLSKAAMNHADFHIDELQARLDEQDSTMAQWQAKLDHLVEQDQFKQSYIKELEDKLMHTAQDAAQDEELLTELKVRIAKFKEMDHKTEQYIHNLEDKVKDDDAKVADLHAQLTRANHENRELQQKLDDLQRRFDQPTDTSRAALEQLRKRMLVNTSSSPSPSSTLAHPSSISPGSPTPFVSSSPPRHGSAVLASTMASLQHVQTEYAALKEKYKLWNAQDDQDDKKAHQASADGHTNEPAHPSCTDPSPDALSMATQDRVKNVVHQYQSQLDRIDNCLDRTDKLLQVFDGTENEAKQQDLTQLQLQLADRKQTIETTLAYFKSTMDTLLQSPDNQAQVQAQVADALEQVELHRSKTFVLQTRLQKIEVTLHSQLQHQRRKSSLPMDQAHDSIEQLMKKMDAMKIQLEIPHPS